MFLPATGSVNGEEEQLVRRLQDVQLAPPPSREKGFWERMKEVLGA